MLQILVQNWTEVVATFIVRIQLITQYVVEKMSYLSVAVQTVQSRPTNNLDSNQNFKCFRDYVQSNSHSRPCQTDVMEKATEYCTVYTDSE